MKNLLILSFIVIFSSTYAQKQANNWYFGERAGISFNNGTPVFLLNSSMNHNNGCATISDSDGNLLFYTNGMTVWNKNHQPMPNGTGLLGSSSGFQNCVIVPFPEIMDKFYIFTVGSCDNMNTNCIGLHYSIVDISLGNGGDIDPFYKNISLLHSPLSIEKVTALRHTNNEDYWIIVRNLSEPDNEFHAYQITKNGINPTPVRSPSLVFTPCFTGANRGAMKVSPDGKNFISMNVYAYAGTSGNEIGSFDASTGLVSILFTFETSFGNFHGRGAEFSQNSNFLYLTNEAADYQNHILQYDLTKVYNYSEFLASMTDIGLGGKSRDLQAGPDGKIYVARHNKEYLGVINNPELQGTACDYDSLGVYLGGRYCKYSLPQFIQTYFLRFEYEGECAGENFIFTPNFNPVPDSIHWDFGDPGSGANNTSNELNPAHTYLQSGIYTVTAFVRYPDGRTETATREVTVTALPEPYPVSDTVICKGSTVTLQAESGFDSYLWSNNQTTDFIMVSDTGSYWVEAVNADGCIGRDTVHVGWHPLPQLTTDTIISPTTCGNSIGAITGVNIIGGTPPYNVFWLNSIGDTIGTTNNLYNLGVENYYLWVTDQSGCNVLVASIDIQNFDHNFIITGVDPTDTRCNQPLGELDVHVQSGLSDRLFYSIDNWATYQTNGSFTGLLPDSYYVKVKDSLDCEAVYAGNPVIIQNLPGLTVTDVIIGEETDNNADGSITIIASGDTLRFSLDGAAPQVGNLFDLLSSGDYTVTVTDMYGCDSTFTVYVPRKSGTTLFASAGDTMVCNGQRGREPLMVNNFKDITSFEITLAFNNLLVDVTGYINADAQIASGLETVYFPSAGTINIKWSETSAVTLPDSTVLLDLIVEGKNAGLSSVDWVETNNQTMFINQLGIAVNVEPVMGSVQIAPSPHIWGFYQENVCEFSTLTQMAIPGGGTGIMTVIWETPKGFSSGPEYQIDTARLDDSGFYRIKVVDQMHCVATDSVEVTVFPLPTVNLPFTNPTHDTIYYEQTFQLETTPGYASYQWNTGDTTYYITITEEGSYSVIVQTNEGCTSTNSAYLKDIYMPFYIVVPNAFTPNGDGLNDTFRPVATGDLIRQFSMVIYNRWGQMVFETSDYSAGWDGKDAPAGVYSWVISYSNHTGKVFKMRGSVTVVK
jgi:gliding motility-associated-like protein